MVDDVIFDAFGHDLAQVASLDQFRHGSLPSIDFIYK